MLSFYKQILSSRSLMAIDFNGLSLSDIENCFFILLSNPYIDKVELCSHITVPSGSIVLDILCTHPKFVKKYFHNHTINNFLNLTEIKRPNSSFQPIIRNSAESITFEFTNGNASEVMIGAMTLPGAIERYVNDRLNNRSKIDIFNSFSSDNEDNIRDITNLCNIYSAGNVTTIAINNSLFMSTGYLYVLVEGEPIIILASMKFYETLADFIVRKIQNQ